MSQNRKKQSVPRIDAAERRAKPGATAKGAPSPVTPVAQATQRQATLGKPSSDVSNLASCEAALARVIELAEKLAQDSRAQSPAGRVALEGGAPQDPAPQDQAAGGEASPFDAVARERLTSALRGLEPETALKLRTLMVAGRDGRSIDAVNVNMSMSDADAGFAAMAVDSGENGPLLTDYLRRGHALACAAGINLEGPLVDWQAQVPHSLDERAWLSFGRQLATSNPRDWSCLAIIDPGTRELGKLYLKLGDHAWWSFQAVLDRPTAAILEKERRSLAKRRLKGVSASTLAGVVSQLGSAQGRALRRAGRAICARVGYRGEAAAAV